MPDPPSVASLAERGIDISDQTPRAVTRELLSAVDLVVVTLGNEAVVGAPSGTLVERWEIDEPSLRGIDGIERMRLVRDDIADRVQALVRDLVPQE